jgi:hypothetical protein
MLLLIIKLGFQTEDMGSFGRGVHQAKSDHCGNDEQGKGAEDENSRLPECLRHALSEIADGLPEITDILMVNKAVRPSQELVEQDDHRLIRVVAPC